MANWVSPKEKNRRWNGTVVIALLSLLALALVGCSNASPPAAEPPPPPAQGAAGNAAPTAAAPAANATPAQGMAGNAAPTPAAPAANAAPAAPTQAAPAPAAAAAEPVQVVTDLSFIADFVRQVGGDRVEVNHLVPLGGDAHSYQTSTRDSVNVAEADVIFSNGADLSPVVDEVIAGAGGSGIRVTLSDGLEPAELVELPFPEADHHDHAGEGDEHGEEMVEVHGRLLVGDGEAGVLSVIDLESGAVDYNAYDLGSRAGRIYKFGNGRYAIAVSSDANRVHILDGGIYLEPHDDHFDMVEAAFQPVGVELAGDNPVHLYVSGEWATVFYDGSGEVALINAADLAAQGAAYQPARMNSGPHHGAAVPLEDNLFAVTPQHPDYASNPEDYRLPVGADIRDLAGNILYSATGCPQLHGDASNGHIAVFGCAGGVLAVEADHGEFSHAFIPAPAGSPEDFRLTSVWGYEGLDHFFALGSAVGLYLVEPEDGAMEQLIAAEEARRPIQVALSYDGELLLVVMSDGEVRMYDAHDGDLLAASADALTGPIDTGFWGRPHLATAPGHIYITDSGAGEVLALDRHDLEVVGRWAVDGKPTKIAFVGILGKGDEDGHDDHDGHDEHDGHDDHGHGHDHGAGDPHFWQNPRFAVHYVEQIAAGLSQVDPDNAAFYRANADAYIAQLRELDAYIAGQIDAIPPENRVMVTFHDAFGYFGSRYGMEVMAFVGGHGGDVSAEDIAAVLELVKDRGLPAIFTEPQFMEDVVQETAREAAIKYAIIHSLPSPDYPDYIGMMRANADALATNLR